MQPKSNLQQFIASVRVSGIDQGADPNAMENFRAEILVRKYLKLSGISYDDSSHGLMIVVGVESLNDKAAKRQAADEAFEIANAVLRQIEGVRVEILEVKPASP